MSPMVPGSCLLKGLALEAMRMAFAKSSYGMTAAALSSTTVSETAEVLSGDLRIKLTPLGVASQVSGMCRTKAISPFSGNLMSLAAAKPAETKATVMIAARRAKVRMCFIVDQFRLSDAEE